MLKIDEKAFIGLVLEGFFYGLYSGIFAMYVQIQASKKDSNKLQNIISYSICALYGLSVVLFVCDFTFPIYQLLGKPMDSLLHINFIESTSFACCDFIAQFILIYRCWIMWGCKFRVVIIPTLLAFAFLGTWLASGGSAYISLNRLATPQWGYFMAPTSLALSLAVNALVTSLIVFRLFKVLQEVRATSDDKILDATSGNKRLRRVILVLIESGMALFSIQLVQLVLNIVRTEAAIRAFSIVNSTYNMLNGIIPTIILVRTSMGLSFHDEKSMEEVISGNLRFASNHPTSVPEMGSIGVVGQDNRDNDPIEVQRSNDIEVVDG